MKKLFTAVSLLFAFVVHADLDTAKQLENSIVLEMPAHFIKVASDGTGIVKYVGCAGCTPKIYKITKETIVTINGKKANIVSAKRKLGGQICMARVNTSTNEVLAIRW